MPGSAQSRQVSLETADASLYLLYFAGMSTTGIPAYPAAAAETWVPGQSHRGRLSMTLVPSGAERCDVAGWSPWWCHLGSTSAAHSEAWRMRACWCVGSALGCCRCRQRSRCTWGTGAVLRRRQQVGASDVSDCRCGPARHDAGGGGAHACACQLACMCTCTDAIAPAMVST